MTKRRWLPRIIVAGGVTIGIVAALIWFQERGLEEVELRLESGDVEGALAAVDYYLEKRPTDERGIALRARTLVLAGYPQEAARLFEQVGAAEIEDLRAWSTALLTIGQWDRALPILDRIAQVEPADGDTLEQITICQFELGHHQAALDAGRRLSELPGFEAIGHLQLASMLTEWESSLKAARHYEQVLRYRPQASGLPMPPADFFLAYADSLLAAGNARQAVEVLEHRSKQDPSLEITLRLGEAWQRLGEHGKARDCFEQIIRKQSDHRQARLWLAETALQQEDAKNAVELLRPLVEKSRLNAGGAYLLLRAYTMLGDDAMVEQWQEKTTTLRLRERRLSALQVEVDRKPNTPRAFTISAYLAADKQDWESAAQTLATLLREVPESYEQAFVQELVEAVRSRGTLPAIDSIPPLLGR
jgi:tetratricopeptide (TPR) repeat protein